MDMIKRDIRAFVVENFLFGDENHPLTDTCSFIETGIIDSTGVLELVAFIEERYGITVADAEMVPANLDSLASLAAFVSAKSKTAAAA